MTYHTIHIMPYFVVRVGVHLDGNGEGDVTVASKHENDSWGEAVELSCAHLSKRSILEFCKMVKTIIGVDITSTVYPQG